MFSLNFNKTIFIFCLMLLPGYVQGQVIGCVEAPKMITSSITSQVQTSCGMDQNLQNTQNLIKTLEHNVQTISEEQTKRDFFEKLKEQAIADQAINALNAWEHLGYGDKQHWDERVPDGCIRDYPAANNSVIKFIQQRNAFYKDLSAEQFQAQKRQEWQEYQTQLIHFSQTLEQLNRKISIDNSRLKNINSHDQRPFAQQLVTPDPSGIYRQASEERDFHIFQAYETSNLFPVLLTDFDKRQSLEPPQGGTSGLTLSYYLNTISNDLSENPNVKLFGGSPQVLMERYIKKAVERMHQNALATLGQACELSYSEDNLRKLVLLDGLTQKVTAQHPEFQSFACSISTDIQKLRDPEKGWTKSVLYLGGMGLSCGLGWAVTGPVACLTYVGVTGAGIGAYETYHSVNKALTLNRDNKVIHDFFLSSTEGTGTVSTKAYRDTEEALKRETLQAWINGTFSAMDAVMLTSLVQRGVVPLRELTVVEESTENISKMRRNSGKLLIRGQKPLSVPQPIPIGKTYSYEGASGVPSSLKRKNWQVVKKEIPNPDRLSERLIQEELITVANGDERFSFARSQFDQLFKTNPNLPTPAIRGRIDLPGDFSSKSANVGEDLLVIRSKSGNLHTGQFGGITPTHENIYIIRDGKKHVIHLDKVDAIKINPTLTVGEARVNTAPEELAHAQRHFAATVPQNFSGSVITRWATPQEMMKDPIVVHALSGLDDVKVGRRTLEEVKQNLSDVGIYISEYDPAKGRYVLSFKTKEPVGFTGVRKMADNESFVVKPRGAVGGSAEVVGQSPRSNKFHLVFMESDEAGQKVLNFKTAMVGDYTLPNVPLPLAQRIMGQSSDDARRLAQEFFESAEGAETRQFWRLDKLQEASDYWRNHALVAAPEEGNLASRSGVLPNPATSEPPKQQLHPVIESERQAGKVLIPWFGTKSKPVAPVVESVPFSVEQTIERGQVIMLPGRNLATVGDQVEARLVGSNFPVSGTFKGSSPDGRLIFYNEKLGSETLVNRSDLNPKTIQIIPASH